MYEILRNALCWSISLIIKYSIDLCNKRVSELFQSVLPIIFKLFLTSTSMLSNHARVQIGARHKFISHLMINYLFNLKKKILIMSEKLLWKINNTVKNLTIMLCFYRDQGSRCGGMGMGWASPSHFSRRVCENFEFSLKNCLANFCRQLSSWLFSARQSAKFFVPPTSENYRDRKKTDYLRMQVLQYTEYNEGNYWKRFLRNKNFSYR